MGCGIGMATDVAARVNRLKDEGKVPQWAAWYAVESGLAREEANAMEKALRTECGPHCAGQPGGGFKSGRAWSVYRIDW